MDHGEALEGWREVNLPLDIGMLGSLWVVLDLVRTEQVHDEAREEALGDLDQVVVVRVGHVELAHGELRVVCEVDAFVAEVAADLVHSVDASNNQHLCLFVYVLMLILSIFQAKFFIILSSFPPTNVIRFQ